MPYWERSGHCTRCEIELAADARLLIVKEQIIWEAGEDYAFHEPRWVPVCEACVTLKERATQTKSRRCAGCNRTMLGPDRGWRRSTCSPRCQQRVRRRSRRMARRAPVCRACGTTFSSKRSDARYCSSPCRQSAYRRRLAPLSEIHGHL